MSFKNIHYDRRLGKMYLWDDEIPSNTEPKVIDFIPYYFVRSPKNTGIKSIFGNNVTKKEFRNYYEYKRSNDDLENNGTAFENNVKPEIQFLVDSYFEIPDDQIQKPKIYYSVVDIEVDTTKVDNTKIVKCKIESGEEDFYTLQEIKRLRIPPKVWDDKEKEWIDFSENLFLSSYGFPEPHKAERPICAISVYNSKINKVYTFGYKEYDGESLSEEWWRYIKCNSEIDLIEKFLHFMQKTSPDVITGWNLYKFDMPYIINRIRNLFPGTSNRKSNTSDGLMDLTSPKARALIEKLSPIGIVTYWNAAQKNDTTKENEIRMNVDIAGVSILDYMDMYKQYSPNKLESYSLDFVSRYELEKGKLEYGEYKNLTELFNFNYNKYIDYNIVDVKRVKQLQDKLGYIDLVQALSLLSKCPMKFYDAVTHLSEGTFLTYYRRHNMCAPFAPNGVKEEFKAAIVKDPIPALFRWLVDLDISSSYPAQMIAMNMGLETYYGAIYQFVIDGNKVEPSEQEIVNCVRAREFPAFSIIPSTSGTDEKVWERLKIVSGDELKEFNQKLKDGLFSISPNGIIFRTDIKGTIAEVERYIYYKRVEVRAQQKKIGELRDKIKDQDSKEYQDLDNKLNQFKNLQLALKLILNGSYGAISVPYFRLFNPYIPTAITAGGRWSVLNGEKFTNELMNDVKKSEKLVDILDELKKRAA